MNKAFLLIALLLLFFSGLQAQITITKGNGKNYVLTPNGGWEEVNYEPNRKKVHSYKIPFESNMLIDGLNKKYGIRYNPEKWDVLRGPSYNKTELYNFELEFHHKNGEGFGLILADTAKRSIEIIITASMDRIKKSSANFKVVYGEVFRVNRNMVYMVIIQATQRGIL